jgi:hypothetical protein
MSPLISWNYCHIIESDRRFSVWCWKSVSEPPRTGLWLKTRSTLIWAVVGFGYNWRTYYVWKSVVQFLASCTSFLGLIIVNKLASVHVITRVSGLRKLGIYVQYMGRNTKQEIFCPMSWRLSGKEPSWACLRASSTPWHGQPQGSRNGGLEWETNLRLRMWSAISVCGRGCHVKRRIQSSDAPTFLPLSLLAFFGRGA